MCKSPLRTAVLLLLVALGTTRFEPVAYADVKDDSAKVAGEHFRKGMVHFQLDEYAEAITEWQEGFRVKSSSAFLYNIAKAYRLSKNPEKALSYYKKYLSMDPKAPNRPEVEGQIESLTKIVEAQAAAPTPQASPEPVAPRPVVVQPAPVVVAPTPTPTPATSPAITSISSDAALTAHPVEKKPLVKKGWFWAVVVTSTVVVAGAVVTGVYFGTRSSGTSSIGTVRF